MLSQTTLQPRKVFSLGICFRIRWNGYKGRTFSREQPSFFCFKLRQFCCRSGKRKKEVKCHNVGEAISKLTEEQELKVQYFKRTASLLKCVPTDDSYWYSFTDITSVLPTPELSGQTKRQAGRTLRGCSWSIEIWNTVNTWTVLFFNPYFTQFYLFLSVFKVRSIMSIK